MVKRAEVARRRAKGGGWGGGYCWVAVGGVCFHLSGMGFYLRKSLRLGPLRFNLSKSGVGVSAGVKGLRVGTGPRGAYVHAGRGGVYYRKTFGAGSGGVAAPPRVPGVPRVSAAAPAGIAPPSEVFDSGAAAAMRDETSAGLLDQLGAARRAQPFLPAAGFGVVGVALLALFGVVPPLVGGLLLAVALAALFFVAARDAERSAVAVFYELEPEVRAACEALHGVLEEIAGCGGLWQVESRCEVENTKYSGGAAATRNANPIAITFEPPKFLKTNVPTPTVPVGRQQMVFLPDRVLFIDAGGIGSIAYAELGVRVSTGTFVELGRVPADAEVTGRTWRYTNKDGGPDRRFKDNHEIPIVRYEEIDFESPSGLRERITVSKTGLGARLAGAASGLAAALAARRPAEPPSGPYYVSVAGGVHGPYTLAEMTEWVATGDFDPGTLICHEADQTWVPVGAYFAV